MSVHSPARPTIDSIHLLRCLDVLMVECSVTRAAARLNVSQATMSHALARLRQVFGDPLLIKRAGGMAPTSRGLELRTQVAALLRALGRMLEGPTVFTPALARMRFTMMLPEFVEPLLVPALISRLERDAPGVEVEFRAPDPIHAFEMLAQGSVDLRLGYWPTTATGLHYKMLSRERLVCIARRRHPRIRGRIDVEDFLAARHVRTHRERTSVSMNAVDHAVARLGTKLHVAVRVPNAYGLAHVVSQSLLIGIVTERLARHLSGIFPLQAAPLPIAVPERRTALYWHERTHKDEPHYWFRSLVTEIALHS